jgi:hypothetical protein
MLKGNFLKFFFKKKRKKKQDKNIFGVFIFITCSIEI